LVIFSAVKASWCLIEFSFSSVSSNGRRRFSDLSWNYEQPRLLLLLTPTLAACSRFRDPKFIMVDNHSSHKMPHIRNLVTDNGHVYQFRATHSPDFAPVELCFAQIKSFMKANEVQVRSTNLVEWATLAVNSITTDQIKRYYAHSHYLVTGEPFKPYTGWQ
jgi:hypothetical protein